MATKLSGWIAVISLLALAVGCDQDIAFVIYQNQVPGDGCVVTAESNLHQPQGLLDVSLGKGYQLFPLVQNDMPAIKEATNPYGEQADPNTLHLREFTVKLDVSGIDQQLAQQLLEFTFPTSGTLNPGDKRASQVEVIPADLAGKLEIPSNARPTIIAEVRAVADSSGGRVESVPFFYPIELCDGCLVKTFDRCVTDAPLSNDGNVCGIPQDAPLLCCQDPDLGLVCPAGADE